MKKFPAVHVSRLRKMAKDIRAEEARLQTQFGDPLPRSVRASRWLDLRAITEILWCIQKAEDE